MTDQLQPGRLLGRMIHQPHLAWLRNHGEVLATGALALLLQDPRLDAAFRGLLRGLGGGDFDPLRWRAEHPLDGGRVDLVGTAGDHAQVFVEGKLGAALKPDQIRCYAKALAGEAPTLLVVLVPDRRRSEAVLRLTEAYPQALGAGTTRATLDSVTILVVTWEHVLQQLLQAVADAPASNGDVEQLAALIDALENIDVPAISPADLGDAWRHRESDWFTLVNRVTGKLNASDRMPAGQDLPYVQRRYVAPEGGRRLQLAIGVRVPVEGTASPLWLRYHARTAGFNAARTKLSNSILTDEVVEEGGHLWLPLQPRYDAGAADVVDDLVEQVLRIDEIARGNSALRDRLLEHAA